MRDKCIFLQSPSSRIRHSLATANARHNLSVVDHKDIRQRIESRLTELGLGVKPTSIAAGLGETTLRNYLKGMTASLTVDSVSKLASALQVSTQWILHGEEADVVQIWDRIPFTRRSLALEVMKTFAREDVSM